MKSNNYGGIKIYEENLQNDFFQGDVIRIDLNEVKFQEFTPHKPKNSLSKQIKVQVHDYFAVILSHSCDVSIKNVGKRNRFVFSPLRIVFPKLIEPLNGDLLEYNNLTFGVYISR